MISVAQTEQRRTNNARIATARRAATHCKRGHEFTPENTYWQPGDGRRRCVTCKSDNGWYHYRGLEMQA